ncbi:hypothetical protein AB6A40_003600 [Gnathostoma spinigerum]|uniref:Uncharacterized protein n=1 Tax=Gnathostoma spinigerum TaxID=75299 RepID=A0ABD6ECH2_9BILA
MVLASLLTLAVVLSYIFIDELKNLGRALNGSSRLPKPLTSGTPKGMKKTKLRNVPSDIFDTNSIVSAVSTVSPQRFEKIEISDKELYRQIQEKINRMLIANDQ